MKGNSDFHDDQIQDDDLRARFAELRRTEEAATPPFIFPSLGRAERNRRWLTARLIAVGVCVLVAASVFLARLGSPRPERNVKTVASITEWKSPTDFLLKTPGNELLRTVPAIGVWHDYTAVDPAPKHPQTEKKVLP
jgi:hypothetical protein